MKTADGRANLSSCPGIPKSVHDNPNHFATRMFELDRLTCIHKCYVNNFTKAFNSTTHCQLDGDSCNTGAMQVFCLAYYYRNWLLDTWEYNHTYVGCVIF